MKRLISLTLISVVFIGSVVPAFSQRDTRRSGTKSDVRETPSRLDQVRASTSGAGVLVEWEAADPNTFGFLVFRTDGAGSRMVSPNAILGSAVAAGSSRFAMEKYSFFDPEGSLSALYHVQTLYMDGKTRTSEQVSPEYVPDLRSADGSGVQELNRQASDAKANGTILQNRLELPRTLAKDAELSQLVADPTTHQWAISQPGVKIGVRSEGFYRVSKADLLAAGFNVNGNSSLWQLYVEGVEQAMIIGPNADYIEFFGRGTDTVESDTRTYYLVSGPVPGKRIGSKVARPSFTTVTARNYAQTTLIKQRTSYVNQVLNGDAENYWGVCGKYFWRRDV